MMFATLFLLTITIASLGSESAAKKRAAAQLVTKCVVPNTVALTFDDGPYIYLKDIIDTLQAAKAVGTFFFNGKNFDCIYNEGAAEGVKYAYDNGHQIASHTWSHAHLNTLTKDQLNEEFSRVDEAVQKITGAVPAFMRPPFGEYNDQVLEVADARGQTVALWDFDSEDSHGATLEESKQLYDTAISGHPSTILTLNHEIYETTSHQLLPYAIQKLQEAGYTLVSVADCLGKPAYQSVGAPGLRDSSWKC